MISSIITLLRPRQWFKNFFVFLPIIFSQELTDPQKANAILGVFVSFCLVSSAIYAFNDVIDVRRDKLHPHKKKRPIASGKITPFLGLIISVIMLLLGMMFAVITSGKLVSVLLIYVLFSVGYALKLKEVVILDVMIIAAGYVLRILAGASVSSQSPSHWILMSAFFLSLFLAFAKRRAELSHRSPHIKLQRSVLNQYSKTMLDHILASTMAVTIMCYSLYASSDYVRTRFGTDSLIYTIPFVVFGIFHYFQRLKMTKSGEDPTEVLLSDKTTLVNVLLWAGVCVLIIYF